MCVSTSSSLFEDEDEDEASEAKTKARTRSRAKARARTRLRGSYRKHSTGGKCGQAFGGQARYYGRWAKGEQSRFERFELYIWGGGGVRYVWGGGQACHASSRHVSSRARVRSGGQTSGQAGRQAIRADGLAADQAGGLNENSQLLATSNRLSGDWLQPVPVG
ncbi:hypothetical protein BC827DRAFT_1159353 [Russula dissimulans]|nr:hypothetical protein BC827DRAFT_1159353 [Russula dissimulans]